MHSPKLALNSSILILVAGLVSNQELAAQAAPPTDVQPVRVYSREVVVDINVTDSKGNPVHNLTKDNFTVLEDGKQIVPRSFREHRPDQELADTPTFPKPSLPPNTFTNGGQTESVRPLDILLLDSLDTPIATQAISQKRMADFVDKMPPGSRIAIMSLSASGQLSLVQGFTTDPDLLKKAIKSHKLDMQIPPLEDSGQELDNEPAPDVQQNKRATKAMTTQQPKFDQTLECNHAAARGQYTISAMTDIARYLSGMPGRKNLIWYSGGFPTRMKDKQGEVCYDFNEDIGVVTGLLDHSHVSVYPVDPRALDIAASEVSTSRIGRIQALEHLNMEAIAGDTGGKTFFNNNDLAAAATQAIEAGSDYYTITYTPPNQTLDTRKRTISVEVDKPDLNLLYKHAYHALPRGIALSGKPIEKATPLQSAMMRGTLQPSEILFHVTVVAAPATDVVLPPGNNADPKAMKPPYRCLSLSYLIDLNAIQLDPSSDGNYHGQFEYAVNVYDPGDGKLLNSNVMVVRPSLPLAVYQSMINTGAKVREDIAIPAKGDYILRIGVHDLTTDHLGAIEIPVSAIAPQP